MITYRCATLLLLPCPQTQAHREGAGEGERRGERQIGRTEHSKQNNNQTATVAQ